MAAWSLDHAGDRDGHIAPLGCVEGSSFVILAGPVGDCLQPHSSMKSWLASLACPASSSVMNFQH